MTYRIDVDDASGNTQSIDTFTKLVYGGALNGTHYFDIIIEGAGSTEFTKFAKGFTISIYREGTLVMKGIIDKRIIISGGFLRIQGVEHFTRRLMDANAPAQTWSNQTTETIAGAIMNNVSVYAESVTDVKIIPSFRTAANQSCYDAIVRLSRVASQDFYLNDYTNNELVMENHRGSKTSITTLNEEIDINNIVKTEDDRNKVNKVTIIGKGPGLGSTASQITSSISAGWSQGGNEITIVDRSIDSEAEAGSIATMEFAIRGSTRYNYKFNVIDVGLSFTLGDVIKINSTSTNTVNTNLRIISYKRVITTENETLELEVRGTTERETAEDRLKQFAEQRRFESDAAALKQGTDIGYADDTMSGGVINAPSITDVTGDVTQAQSITDVTGSVTNMTLTATAGISMWTGITVDYTNMGNYKSLCYSHKNILGSPSYYTTRVECRLMNITGGTVASTPITEYPDTSTITHATNAVLDDSTVYSWESGQSFVDENDSIGWFKFHDDNYNASACCGTANNIYSHTHGTHGHSDTFGTSDSNHPHSDTFGTSDSNHPHSDNVTSTDTGHTQ